MEGERYVRGALQHVPLAVVGARLKEKRNSLGLSIRALAEKALVSKTSIVNLEQGHSCRPATLVKIAGVMGLHVERFLEPDAPPKDGRSASVHRHDDDRWFALQELGAGPVEDLRRPLDESERARLRAMGLDPLMMMFRNIPLGAGFIAGIIELKVASEPRQHPGREFLLVLHGQVKVQVGPKTFDLNEGESLYFEASEEHSYGPLPGTIEAASILCIRVD